MTVAQTRKLPAQTRTTSASSVSLSPFLVSRSSVTLSPLISAPFTLVFNLNLNPCLVRDRWKALRTSLSYMLDRTSQQRNRHGYRRTAKRTAACLCDDARACDPSWMQRVQKLSKYCCCYNKVCCAFLTKQHNSL